MLRLTSPPRVVPTVGGDKVYTPIWKKNKNLSKYQVKYNNKWCVGLHEIILPQALPWIYVLCTYYAD